MQTDEEVLARNKINTCNKINDKEKKINCMFDVLHNITKAQDITNLIIRKTIDDSEDRRWIPIHLVDDANAIILDVSTHKGNPELISAYGYTDEKVRGIINKWDMIKRRQEQRYEYDMN